MATIAEELAENLVELNQAKANIKTAIQSKGQDLTDVPFTQYADKINAIQTGGGVNFLQWKCDNTKNLSYVFYNYKGTEIPFTKGLDTSQVTSMGNMFSGCSNITELDLSSFDTSKVTEFSNLFNSCTNLKTILGTIDVISASYSIQLFALCREIETFTIKNIKQSFTTSTSNSYNSKLTLDTLVNIFKELWDLTGSTSKTLRLSTTNKTTIANIYVKLVEPTEEEIAADPNIIYKKSCVVCESTDEGAMTITEYGVSKNWVIS